LHARKSTQVGLDSGEEFVDNGGMSSIEAKEKPIENVFCNDYNFRIPPYQRPYAWQVDQASQLFDDLLTFMKEEANGADPYFLGSVVLIKSPDDAVADVVDGQQRLITLAILFGAIRDRLPKAKDDIAEFLLEKGNEFRKTPDRYRLTPRQRDQDFFHRDIIGEAGLRVDIDPAQLPDSQQNMWNNANEFRKRLIPMSDSEVAKFTSFIIKRCFLVIVTTSNFGAAYRIFSVLNNRGLDLQTTDILKADLIGDIAEGKRMAYTERWENIEQTLGRDAFLELFAHIRTIDRKAKPKTSILDDYKVLLTEWKPEAFIDERVGPYAKAFQVLRDAAHHASAGAEPVNTLLRALNLISNVDWLPPAMRIYQIHKSNAEQLARWLAGLERLAASMMIRGLYANARLERHAKVLSWLENGGDLEGEGSPFILDEEERKETRKVLNGSVYKLTAARPLLLRLDQLLADEGSRYDHSIISIEHVLPQSPPAGSQWLEWFPDDKQRNDWTHRLGNLVLLSRRKNSRASNFEFKKKKDTYFRQGKVSSFVLTTDVINEEQWTPEILERRQARLLKVLADAWQLG
jgi:hypothetical protein